MQTRFPIRKHMTLSNPGATPSNTMRNTAKKTPFWSHISPDLEIWPRGLQLDHIQALIATASPVSRKSHAVRGHKSRIKRTLERHIARKSQCLRIINVFTCAEAKIDKAEDLNTEEISRETQSREEPMRYTVTESSPVPDCDEAYRNQIPRRLQPTPPEGTVIEGCTWYSDYLMSYNASQFILEHKLRHSEQTCLHQHHTLNIISSQCENSEKERKKGLEIIHKQSQEMLRMKQELNELKRTIRHSEEHKLDDLESDMSSQSRKIRELQNEIKYLEWRNQHSFTKPPPENLEEFFQLTDHLVNTRRKINKYDLLGSGRDFESIQSEIALEQDPEQFVFGEVFTFLSRKFRRGTIMTYLNRLGLVEQHSVEEAAMRSRRRALNITRQHQYRSRQGYKRRKLHQERVQEELKASTWLWQID